MTSPAPPKDVLPRATWLLTVGIAGLLGGNLVAKEQYLGLGLTLVSLALTWVGTRRFEAAQQGHAGGRGGAALVMGFSIAMIVTAMAHGTVWPVARPVEVPIGMAPIGAYLFVSWSKTTKPGRGGDGSMPSTNGRTGSQAAPGPAA